MDVELVGLGITVSCLVDTGSEVSTITESFFEQHLKPLGAEILRNTQWLQLKAANGIDIPYVGYMQLDVKIGDTVFPTKGVLIVKDSPDSVMRQRKLATPGLLGMNILADLGEEWKQLSQQNTHLGTARVAQRQWIPARSGVAVLAMGIHTSSTGSDQSFMVQAGETALPQGVICCNTVAQNLDGQFYVRVLNLSDRGIWLGKGNQLGEICSYHCVEPLEPGLRHSVVINEGFVSWEQSSSQSECRLDTSEKPFVPDLESLECSEQEKVTIEKFFLEFQDLFREDQVGYTDVIKCNIPLVDEAPVRYAYRRIPPKDYQDVWEHIQGLISKGVVTPSTSPYASPIVILRKKDGDIRMCVDYRGLNLKTVRDAFPLPRIDEALDSLHGSKWFSTMDLASGFNQIAMEDKDRPKTAFTTPFGLFEYLRMPFGVVNGPATFMRLMQCCFGDLMHLTMLVYIDDIIVYSKNICQMLERLREVFNRLRKFGLKLKGSKCHFFQESVKYLGHIVSKEGVSTDPSKISAVKDWPVPTDVKKLRSFLGFAGYYRKYVPHFSELAGPLHQLVSQCLPADPKRKAKSQTMGRCGRKLGSDCRPIKSVTAFHWEPEHQKAFDQLKKLLTEAPILGFADFSKPFIVEVDASMRGLGAVLSQDQEGKRVVIAYASRGLHKTERNMDNYSSRKLELLALKWSITEKFREYLIGSKFTVFTDNNPLVYLRTAKLTAVEHRWVAALASFDFRMEYKAGKVNVNADALSRQPDPVERENLLELNCFQLPISCEEIQVHQNRHDGIGMIIPPEFRAVSRCVVHVQETQTQVKDDKVDKTVTSDPKASMAQAQLQDIDISPIYQVVKESRTLSREELVTLSKTSRLLYKKNLWIDDEGVLRCRLINPKAGILEPIVLPAVKKKGILLSLHQGMGHQGVDRTLALLRPRAYWPKMDRDVTSWIEKCVRCQKGKHPSRRIRTPISSFAVKRPLEIVAMDFTMMERSSDGYENLFVMSDLFSKYLVAVPMRNQKAAPTAQKILSEWFLKLGVPTKLHSDQGRNFESKIIAELCSLYGVTKTRTTPWHPEGNGQVERCNRTIHYLLQTLEPEKKKHWPKYLPELVYMYNATPHASTGYSPYYLMFGRDPRLPVDIQLGTDVEEFEGETHEWLREHQERLTEAYTKANSRLQEKAKANQERRNASAQDHPLEIGERVWLRSRPLGRNKIGDYFGDDVYKVINKLPDHVYCITKADGTGDPKTRKRQDLKICRMCNDNTPTSPITVSESNTSSKVPYSEPTVLETNEEESKFEWEILLENPEKEQVSVQSIPIENSEVSRSSSMLHTGLDVVDSEEQVNVQSMPLYGPEVRRSSRIAGMSSDEPKVITNPVPEVPEVRHSGRKNAGLHANPHHLPVSINSQSVHSNLSKSDFLIQMSTNLLREASQLFDH